MRTWRVTLACPEGCHIPPSPTLPLNLAHSAKDIPELSGPKSGDDCPINSEDGKDFRRTYSARSETVVEKATYRGPWNRRLQTDDPSRLMSKFAQRSS